MPDKQINPALLESNESSDDKPPPAQTNSSVKGVRVVQPVSQDLSNTVSMTSVATKAESPAGEVSAIYSHPATSSDQLQPPSLSNIPAQAHTYSQPFVGSQLPKEKKKLPVGVYAIAGFTFLGFLGGFFDTSQGSVFYTFAMLMNLFLAIGLIMRQDAARKIMIGLSAILLILTVIVIILLALLQQRISDSKADYDTAVNKINQSRLTTTQKEQLDSMSKSLESMQKQAGKAISYSYIKYGVSAVASVVIIGYLMRPKVREAFEGG